MTGNDVLFFKMGCSVKQHIGFDYKGRDKELQGIYRLQRSLKEIIKAQAEVGPNGA